MTQGCGSAGPVRPRGHGAKGRVSRPLHLGVRSPRLASPRLASPRLASPRLASPRLARLPEPRLEPLELGAYVRRVVALDGRCPVHVVGKQPVELLADGPLLEQALLNLIRNAIDASLACRGVVTVDWHADADSAVLSIIDEGAGVANPDNLFVPLFSTKPQGSGIGLVLARNIVEAHGGQLRLDNRRRASGCVARVTLPRAPRALARGARGFVRVVPLGSSHSALSERLRFGHRATLERELN